MGNTFTNPIHIDIISTEQSFLEMLEKALNEQVESVDSQQQALVKVRHALIRERGRIRKRLTQLKGKSCKQVA